MKSLTSVTLFLIFYLCFVKAEMNPLGVPKSVNLDDNLSNFLQLEQGVSTSVLRLRDSINRSAMDVTVEEELAREMSLIKQMAQRPLDFLREKNENMSLMETKAAVTTKVNTKLSTKVNTKTFAKIDSKLKARVNNRLMTRRVVPVVDVELDVLRKMQQKYNPTSDQVFQQVMKQDVIGYKPVGRYEDVNFLQVSEEIQDHEYDGLFDFKEPSSMLQTTMNEQSGHKNDNNDHGVSVINGNVPGYINMHYPTPNPPGWPFSAPTGQQEYSYQPDLNMKTNMPTGKGYRLEPKNSLAHGASEKTNNLVDSDNLYGNMNNMRVNNYRMNGGVPADVLLNSNINSNPGNNVPVMPFNGYQMNGIVQGAIASLPPGTNIGDTAYSPSENTMTLSNHTPDRPMQQQGLMDNQKVAMPYFPSQRPQPLSGNTTPADPSVLLAHGSIHQFSPNPQQTPISAMSQDNLLYLGHTGRERSNMGNNGNTNKQNNKFISPFEQGVSSFLQNGAESTAREGTSPESYPAPQPNDINPAAFQQELMQRRMQQPGYFPNPTPQALSPAYAGNNHNLSAGPAPGSVPSLYPVDNLGLHIPLGRRNQQQPVQQPFGPYTSQAPQQYVNHIEVNPALHPVQYMADTPYFPTESIGDNVLPPAPIEQPVQAGGPMGGFQDPRVNRMGNVYIPSAPYMYGGA